MDNITLSDQQMELLKEYKTAVENFRKANEEYIKVDVMAAEFVLALSLYRLAFFARDKAACVFAASMAESIKEEVSHA